MNLRQIQRIQKRAHKRKRLGEDEKRHDQVHVQELKDMKALLAFYRAQGLDSQEVIKKVARDLKRDPQTIKRHLGEIERVGGQPPDNSLIIRGLSVGDPIADIKARKAGRAVNFMLGNLSDNVVIVKKICPEVLWWGPYDLPSPISVRVDTIEREAKLNPGQTGEYPTVIDKEYKYGKPDVDSFQIVCRSPPGNKYHMRLNFYCRDFATQKPFTVHSDEFDICFYKRSNDILEGRRWEPSGFHLEKADCSSSIDGCG